MGECKTFYKERKFYSMGDKVNCLLKCYLIGLILKVRVFGNQKGANKGFKWPTESLNEDKIVSYLKCIVMTSYIFKVEDLLKWCFI